MSAIDKEPFPRPALYGAAALIGLSLVATGASRIGRLDGRQTGPAVAAAEPALTRDISFVDEANGAVSVRDHATGQLVVVLQPGEDGFIRSVMRGLAHERRGLGMGADPAFRLSERRDGRLLLEDVATGRVIDLGAFGPTNRAAFARILTAQETAG